eukprot:11303090-Alexandrium_andersonii.AAC.1
MGGEFTAAEVKETTRRIKTGKQGGPDEIKPELIKWAAEEAAQELAEFYNSCTRARSFPDSWREATVVGIFKKSDCFDPASYRPISLLNCVYKLYAAMLANRILGWARDKLRPTQY